MNVWPVQRLEQVASIERNMIQPEALVSGIPYIGLEHIASGGDIINVEPVTTGELKSTKFSFSPKHILYGKLRPYLAKIAAPDFSGVCSTEIVPIRAGPEMDRGFLLHFLRQPGQVELATAHSSGANLPRLSPAELAKFEIPVPPLPEQRRIAAILDQADALRANRRATLAQFDEMATAVFIEMFGDPVTNHRQWRRVCINQVAEIITGNTPPRAVPEYYGSHIEWIKSDNLNTGSYYATRATEHLSEAGKHVARTAPVGATLVTCIAGSPTSIGNAAMLDREAAFNQQINAVVPVSVNPRFLYAQLRIGKRLVQEASTGAMKGMVSKSRFEDIKVINPPAELQHQFARNAITLEQQRRISVDALAKTSDLFSSLQHCAFRGEL